MFAFEAFGHGLFSLVVVMADLKQTSKTQPGQMLTPEQLGEFDAHHGLQWRVRGAQRYAEGDAAPPKSSKLFHPPHAPTAKIAAAYIAKNKSRIGDIPPVRMIRKLDQNRSKAIGDAFEAGEHNPDDPQVREAYEALAQESADQMQALLDAGYTVQFHDNSTEPYKHAGKMVEDLNKNKRLKVFSTEHGYGEKIITDEMRRKDPMLQVSKFKDANGKPMLLNDAFRAVHDFFGHSELGNSFGPAGEEMAWLMHSRMFSPKARRALTTETRGQNSWVNFGPHMRRKDGSIPVAGDPDFVPLDQRSFAEQKAFLLPDDIVFDYTSHPQEGESGTAKQSPVKNSKPKSYRYEKDELGREYAVFDDVPIFDEHKGDDGVVYNARLLGRIAKNNNERIEDTGDYVPIVSHHTPEDKDPAKQPEILGFAGPFRLGKIGTKRPRYAILATFKVFKDSLGEFLKRPRRSVEIWPESSPDKRYIDPIAVLGAETPRRDLGLVYSKGNQQPKLRYEMAGAFPGGGNTYIAGDNVKRNEKESPAMALSPEDIQQIVEALRPTIEDIVDSRLGGGAIEGDEPLPQDGVESPEGAEGEEMPPMPEGGAVPAGEGEPEGEEEGEEDMGKAMFAKACAKYSLDKSNADINGARQYMASMSEADRKAVDKYMCSCKASKAEKEQYAKCCTSAAAESYAKASEKAEVERYRREVSAQATKYRKLADKYQKLQSDLVEAKDELTMARRQLRYSKINERLSELEAQGYVIDRDQEVQFLAALPDDQMESHYKRITQHYAKAPGGIIAPSLIEPSVPSQTRSAKYAKAAGDATQQLRMKNPRVSYEQVLGWMCNRGTATPPTLEDLGLA